MNAPRPARGGERAASPRAMGHARWRLALAAWLLLAMVLAQTTGFVHGTVHGNSHHAAPLPAGAIEAHAASSAAATLAHLFDDHDDEAKCRLYDQMSRGECAPTADMPATPSLAVSAAPAAMASPWLCADCLPARARGPPAAS